MVEEKDGLMRKLYCGAAALALASPLPALAQAMDHSGHGGMDMGGHDMPAPAKPPQDRPAQDKPAHDKPAHDMAGMDMAGMDRTAPTAPRTPAPYSEGSGTTRLPGAEAPMQGLHVMAGDWMMMVHGAVSANYTAASGPRGDDKLYATSMLMASATRETSWGRIAARTMLSLEPAMRRDGYPNLFATGETAYGVPLVDRQHPHDLFMELAGRIDVNAPIFGEGGRLFVYGGPVGEPALGPSAFMHRASAANNPEAPISHHWFDSTHITYGVVTAGYAAPKWQVEASAFRGREPDERRWNIESGKLDSWSVRATLNPSPAWSLQASYGELRQPEATHPGEDEHRFTASVHYAGPHVAAMLAYARKQRVPGETLPAWLGEVTWTPDRHNALFGRVEHLRNDELFADHADPLHDTPFTVTKLQAGYARLVPLGPLTLAVGGSVATFLKPAALDVAYGKRPVQATVFARFSLGG